MGHVCSDQINAIEREININADAGKADAGETLLHVWRSLSESTIRRSAGRLNGVHEAPVLLAFLLQLTDQGWAFAESISRASAQTQEDILRSVWWKRPFACPSCERGLDGQQPSEHPDLVRVVSSILARHAQAAWGDVFDANARACSPLADGIPARMGKLRAYGNAIVPQLAAEFIRSVMDVLSI